MECDQLLPGEPDPGRPHDVHPQLHPLLHLHERQVLHCPVTQEVVRSIQPNELYLILDTLRFFT